MPKKYLAIVNVNLEFTVMADNEDQVKEKLFDVNLPDNYVGESFEIVKIIKEN